MSSLVVENWIGDVRWLVVSGEREAVFRALGEYAHAEISALIGGLPEMAILRSSVVDRQRGEQFRATIEASRLAFPVEYAELEALAEGAGASLRDLLMLNLRGDLGGHDDLGCSEFGWTDGRRALLGHNEDGDLRLDGACSLLTLRIDGEPAVVTWWYPGFLPGNAYTLNESGLVWGVDTIHLAHPHAAPSRAFAARRLQRVSSLDDAITFLEDHPVAGAFTYVMGQMGSARLLCIEHAGSQVAARESRSGSECVWHTNHLRHLPGSLDNASLDSQVRGAVLSGINAPPPDQSISWLLEILAGSPPPTGVRAEGPDITLCTFVADLESSTLTILQHGCEAVTRSATELLRGQNPPKNEPVPTATYENDKPRELPGGTRDQ